MIRRLGRLILPAKLKKNIRDLISPQNPHIFQFKSEGRTEVPSPFPGIIDNDNPLMELGYRYNPSKRGHNYLPYYWMHFRDIRKCVEKVLEIGVQTDRSLRMWEDFFPNATIYGIDKDPSCKQFELGRRKIFIGDQEDQNFLESVLSRTGGSLDIVIDDGSHREDHQLGCFEYFFPALTKHGIYVIEDIGIADTEHLTLNKIKKIVDHINYWPSGVESNEWPSVSSFPKSASWIDRNAVGIAFYRYIVFILKGNNPEDNPYLQRKA